VNDSERIEIAVSCPDCDFIPKVEKAGAILDSASGALQVMHNGVRVHTDSHYGSYNTEVIRRLRGHHEPQEERVFHEVLKSIPPRGVILELGSFWAYYSLWFTSAVRNGRAFMVEPLDAALSAGKRNFSVNERQGTFVKASIDNVERPEGDVELWPGMTTAVESTTVDALMSRFSLPKVDILHSDIQGAEVRMLKGAKEALEARSISWIFISTHGENIHQKCAQILRSHHYKIVSQHTPSESYSVDGLLVASSDGTTKPISISRRRSWSAARARVRASLRVRVLEPLGLREETS
jgi:FkbM family methyltransferase